MCTYLMPYYSCTYIIQCCCSVTFFYYCCYYAGIMRRYRKVLCVQYFIRIAPLESV